MDWWARVGLVFTFVLLHFPTQLFTLHPLRARVANTLRGRFPAQHTNRLGLLVHSSSSRLLPMRSLEAILAPTRRQVNAKGLCGGGLIFQPNFLLAQE